MAKTSHFYNELLKLLGESKHWADIRHLHTLVWMVIGLICSGCVSLTKWTIYVDSRATFAQSHQRRFSRWLHNSRINVQRLYSPIIQAALFRWGAEEIVLIEDTTMLWNRYCLIRISIRYRGRAVLIAWRVLKHLARDPISNELWYIISDEPTSLQTFRQYSQRFDIEEEFLDEKSNGFQLEQSLIRSSMALSRLCLVLAIASLFLTAQGQQAVSSGKRRWVDCHWYRGNSYLRLGWEWIKGVLYREWKLFPSLCLSGEFDPEPARASRKQAQKQFEREFTVRSFSYAS